MAEQSMWRYAPSGLLGLSSVIGAYGQYQEGKYAKAASRANASALRASASAVRGQAGQAADLELSAGRFEEKAMRRQGSRLMASNRAAVGASGFDFSGSTVDALADTAAQIELEALTRRYSAQARASQLRYQGELQAWQDETQANMQEWQGNILQRGQFLKAFGTLLSGAGTATSVWPSSPSPSTTWETSKPRNFGGR